jgi:hypothetical protein
MRDCLRPPPRRQPEASAIDSTGNDKRSRPGLGTSCVIGSHRAISDKRLPGPFDRNWTARRLNDARTNIFLLYLCAPPTTWIFYADMVDARGAG